MKALQGVCVGEILSSNLQELRSSCKVAELLNQARFAAFMAQLRYAPTKLTDPDLGTISEVAWSKEGEQRKWANSHPDRKDFHFSCEARCAFERLFPRSARCFKAVLIQSQYFPPYYMRGSVISFSTGRLS